MLLFWPASSLSLLFLPHLLFPQLADTLKAWSLEGTAGPGCTVLLELDQVVVSPLMEMMTSLLDAMREEDKKKKQGYPAGLTHRFSLYLTRFRFSPNRWHQRGPSRLSG